MFFATTEKLSIPVESLHFPMFSAKCCECKNEKRDGHGKLRNGHGKDMDKYFVKSVGTLILVRGRGGSVFVVGGWTLKRPVPCYTDCNIVLS